jgi:hypothetical protein
VGSHHDVRRREAAARHDVVSDPARRQRRAPRRSQKRHIRRPSM